jgi:hypothetical protein
MTLIKQYLAQTYDFFDSKYRNKNLDVKINRVSQPLQFQPPLI